MLPVSLDCTFLIASPRTFTVLSKCTFSTVPLKVLSKRNLINNYMYNMYTSKYYLVGDLVPYMSPLYIFLSLFQENEDNNIYSIDIFTSHHSNWSE